MTTIEITSDIFLPLNCEKIKNQSFEPTVLWWLLCFDDSALKCLCLGFFIISYFLVTFEYSKTRGMVEIVAAITNQVANTDFSIIVLILQIKKSYIKLTKTLDHAIAYYKTCVTEPIHNVVKNNVMYEVTFILILQCTEVHFLFLLDLLLWQ